MRTTIIPSVCEVLARNYSYRNPECYIFERGNEYIPVEGEVLPNEPERLGFGFYDTETKADFYDIKGVVEGLLSKLGAQKVEFERLLLNVALTSSMLSTRAELLSLK